MGLVKRGGYIFMTLIGDHRPRHVHVLRDRIEILKWDLENDRIMFGTANRRIIGLIEQLKKEGKL